MSATPLLQIVQETIPDFDGGNGEHLIKAEKILKARQKISNEFSINEIEEFLNFQKENTNSFSTIFEDENLRKIINSEYFKIDSSKNKIHNIDGILIEEFAEKFEEPVSKFIKNALQKGDWNNLRIFYKQYFPVIHFTTLNELTETISQKNNLIRSVIPYKENYKVFEKEYNHAFNSDFYAFQSDLDAHYFNGEILDINNDIADHQYVEDQYRVSLGKIFMAMVKFDAATEELRKILNDNARIGAGWAKKEQKILKKLTKNKISTEKDYGKTAEWIILSIFYLVVGFCIYKFYDFSGTYLTIFVIYELVLFLILNKQLNEHFNENSTSKNDRSFLRRLKKFTFKLLILQFYMVVISIILGILIGILALAVAAGGFPVVIILIILFRVIKAFRKK